MAEHFQICLSLELISGAWCNQIFCCSQSKQTLLGPMQEFFSSAVEKNPSTGTKKVFADFQKAKPMIVRIFLKMYFWGSFICYSSNEFQTPAN